MVDCIYIATTARDARFLRISVASIRYFYPDLPIKLLLGGKFSPRLLSELRRVAGVEVSNSISSGNYGWGFVKLEPLFQKKQKRFLVLDSDTIFAGPVLDLAGETNAAFIVDDENQSEEETKRLYYDWEKLRLLDPQAEPPRFVFNSGQWFGTSNVLRREDFEPFLSWTMPRTLRYPDVFMPGEQGVFNYVINQKSRSNDKLISRRKIMAWPGNDISEVQLTTFTPRSPLQNRVIVHWAGFKAPFLESLPRFDLLQYFEQFYYGTAGEISRRARAWASATAYKARNLFLKARQRRARLFRRSQRHVPVPARVEP